MNLIKRLGALFGQRDDIPHHLYGALVTQARCKEFYAKAGVPDTLDGRFDLIVLHAFLLIRRLNRSGEAGEALAQKVFDVMFLDLDNSLRELGVGDLSVPKKIKVMAKAFYGRCSAYEAAMEITESEALTAAVSRNIYADQVPPKDAAQAIADYMYAVNQDFEGQDDKTLFRGEVTFPAFSMAKEF